MIDKLRNPPPGLEDVVSQWVSHRGVGFVKSDMPGYVPGTGDSTGGMYDQGHDAIICPAQLSCPALLP
jgi:hypothetical protein